MQTNRTQTMTAKQARAKVYEVKKEAENFAHAYHDVVYDINAEINRAISNMRYECSVKLIDRQNNFFDKLRTYYERLGYGVEISELIGTISDSNFRSGYREVKLSW